MGNLFTFDQEQNITEFRRYVSADPDFYQLVNETGGGELVDLAKIALKTNDFKQLDDTIREKVVKFLYNEGRGDYIDVEELVKARMSLKEGYLVEYLQNNEDKVVDIQNQVKFTKYVCFDIEKRGRYGETILHLCLRHCTLIHDLIARRIIQIFPQMVNDYSLSEQFYGETALHVAIGNEDPIMTKLLLSKRANIHARCFGSTFGPEDQRKRQDTLQSEFPIYKMNTNYIGLAYYGEYPLNFAACLNQEEIVRLLLSKSADPNKQDLNGNTALHMMVIHDNLKMAQIMLENGANMHIKNKQGLTPIALAAKLARHHIYEHLLEDIRQVNWTYANVSSAEYPLENLDSIDTKGGTDFTSILMMLVQSKSEEHLDLFNGLIFEIISQKWEKYVKHRFYIEFVVYLVFLVLCGITLILKRLFFAKIEEMGCIESATEGKMIRHECECVYLYPNDSNRNIRIALEIIVVLFSLLYLAIFTTELFAQKLLISLKALLLNPFKLAFIIGLLCNLIIIPMRFTCNTYGEDVLVVLSIILIPFYILHLGRGFRRSDIFIFTIQIGIKFNLYIWAFISLIFFMGFSQALYIASGYGRPPVHEVFKTPLQSILDCLIFSDHDFVTGYNNLLKSPYTVAGKTVFFFTAIICNVIMTNLLIASFLELYAEVVKSKLEWIRQWAKIVIAFELTMRPDERLKKQKKYIQFNENGEKSIILKWMEKDQRHKEIKKTNASQIRDKLKNVPHNIL